MSCRLKDYHKEGVPLRKSIDIVLGILENTQSITSRVRKDFSTENLIARNLESLGLLVKTHPPASPEVTPKGGTLVLSKRPYLEIKHSYLHIKMGRFVLLKAIRDSDWACFKQFFYARFIELSKKIAKKKDIRTFIRKKYYPQYNEVNFYHWYRLHLSFIKETNVMNILQSDATFSETRFEILDPYSENFSANIFFGDIYDVPDKDQIINIIEKALVIYVNNLSNGSRIGYCETLKTIMQVLLLSSNMFMNELNLSDYAIDYIRRIGAGFMRSNYPILTGGRGFIDRKRVNQVSFRLFSLPSSYFR